ncbi:MAG: AAA family ATPase [Flavobacterium sp.]|nr:AAA family ATPase [Flavobacterium sp.]
MRLAQALITQANFQDPENVRKYFSENTDIVENKIHRLQLHTNYTYEDFVAGIQLINHQTVPVKGKLFNICELAEKDKAKKIPHVLILDEINRVDLSRLFGEVFSALENRNVPIEVSVADFKLNIPDNLYVIGTMNEIDFSLERIDFALRRRFLWFLYGFKADILSQIIWQKNSELNTRLEGEEVGKFIEKSKSLNDALMLLPELGEQYQIGHTFFGEVVDIYARYKEIEGYRNKMKNQLYRTDGAVRILWNISIKPMIEAFFGNLDKETKDEKLKELESKFINGN